MLRHYLSLALRHVARNRLYALISVAGLALGFGAATLIGLYVHDELTYERWLPNSDRIYRVSPSSETSGEAGAGPSDIGLWLANDYPEPLEAATRLFRGGGFFKRDDTELREQIHWADASVFDVFQYPVISGTLDGALDQPDGLVLTRSAARRHFGDDDPLGQTLLYNGREPMVVNAVIEDLPSNTHLAISVLASSRASFSPAAEQDRNPMVTFGGKLWGSFTYFLLRENEPIGPLRESIRTLFDRHAPLSGARKASDIWPLVTRPIRSIHLAGPFDPPEAEQLGAVYTVAAIGLLIMIVASINFVNILTSLGLRRAPEVGVRKALGASRGDLLKQFMGESFCYVLAGSVFGLALAKAALQPLNTFLQRSIDFSMFADWRVACATLGFLALVALTAGAYPSLVLSSFRTATVTKSSRTGGAHAHVRQALVVLQFAVLIGLLIATTVTHRQMALGMREALRQNSDPVVVAYLAQQLPDAGVRAPCTQSLLDRMRAIDGVRLAACSMGLPQQDFQLGAPLVRPGSPPSQVRYLGLGVGFLELYGYRPVAGRFFSAELRTDVSPPENVWTSPESIVLNETAVRQLGFRSAEEAVGQTAMFSHVFRQPITFTPAHEARIIGVVEDFQIGSVRAAIPPAVFFVDEGQAVVLSLKLDGRATPEALEAIDRTWKELGGSGPLSRTFFEQTMQNMYLDLRRQTHVFSAFAGIAIFIAVLGLVGLAAHAAVSRTKEIGIRKAVGGGRREIVRLLLWQFSRPVLLGNVIAWPVAYYVMAAWLQGFARRVELDWWMFAGAGGITLAVAVAAVSMHTWLMAGARPVEALRYR
ncbi:MAG: FtsX-like permease family protein [Lysobacterales bacterium]|nr:MAG: FtsX-like permease family protein [Xanthomonadales bacterium]